MKKLLPILPLFLLAAACAEKKPPARAPEAVPVTIATAAQRDVPVEVRAIGHVEPLATVSVRSLVAGEITKVHFKEGDEVKAGDPLFTIDSRPMMASQHEMEANLERDRVKARNAHADVDRYADLVKKDYVTREQYDAAVANAGSLDATVKADEAMLENARVQLGYTTIRSPINGKTGSLLVHAGNVVKANDVPLVVINQVRPINVAFSVPEQVLPEIQRAGGAGKLTVRSSPKDSAEKPHVGPLTFLDNSVDTKTGTLTLKATYDNKDGALWPGQFVDVALTVRSDPTAIVVPQEAVQTGQNGSYVFVVKSDDTVESRPVTVARTAEKVAVIAKGIAPGERVVTDGQIRLAPGSKVEIKQG
jgi:multidrug efflux system membrane fusion protein